MPSFLLSPFSLPLIVAPAEANAEANMATNAKVNPGTPIDRARPDPTAQASAAAPRLIATDSAEAGNATGGVPAAAER